jgi:hypothetical protein
MKIVFDLAWEFQPSGESAMTVSLNSSLEKGSIAR